MQKPEAFQSKVGVKYTGADSISYASIDVLPFLLGKPWDDVALAYVHALRPSSIRVTSDFYTLDGRSWRVTVYLENGVIASIRQEVEVGLPNKIPHAEALGHALEFGIDSEQVRWHEDAVSYSYIFGEYSKDTKDGRRVPFPGSTMKIPEQFIPDCD